MNVAVSDIKSTSQLKMGHDLNICSADKHTRNTLEATSQMERCTDLEQLEKKKA